MEAHCIFTRWWWGLAPFPRVLRLEVTTDRVASLRIAQDMNEGATTYISARIQRKILFNLDTPR